ncbi:hypothetical protein EGI22_11140 [Lacihabitans sp. LS3-19]|uniref:hypothetical protein n=1 Tax=Lacihabitans sp. LS3-19 TaxID=2487335 RepID=UPI0020CF54DA|nr:hypothetical protein [Lacihabitans sp. LS3-19]MCP9768469.1 hypothetical protein [Lacihabitans sp. LS3-19]
MNNKNTNTLFPNRYKKLSYVLIPLGLIFLGAYLEGIKPDFLNIKVFALASTYMENRFGQIVQTNAMDEIGMSLFIAGLFIMIFTEEKFENEITNTFRLKAFFFAIKATLIIWLLTYWLFFGYIIFPISMALFVLFLIVYYLYFKYLYKSKANFF